MKSLDTYETFNIQCVADVELEKIVLCATRCLSRFRTQAISRELSRAWPECQSCELLKTVPLRSISFCSLSSTIFNQRAQFAKFIEDLVYEVNRRKHRQQQTT